MSVFFWDAYIESNLDLKEAGITTEAEAIRHFETYGIHEGRTFFSPWTEYIQIHLDLKAAGINSEAQAIHHFKTFGIHEDRVCFLPWSMYLESNPDLKKAGLNTEEEAICHYKTYGMHEGRTYLSTWITYMESNPDLKAAGINTEAKAMQHYYKRNGMNECRPCFPQVPVFEFKSYRNYFAGKTGLQIGGRNREAPDLGPISAATKLDCLPVYNACTTQTYQFIYSEHILQKLENPLHALVEMSYMTEQGGLALHILPWKAATFDIFQRPVTAFNELLYLHKHREQRNKIDTLEFEDSYSTGFFERWAHKPFQTQDSHVFDFDLIARCFHYAGYDVLDVQLIWPYHQIVLARKRFIDIDYKDDS